MKINKITYKGKAKIIDSEDGKYVIKEKNKSLKDLFNYLEDRNFKDYPKIIEEDDNNIKYEYFDNFKIEDVTHETDFIKSISSLHTKTTYFKDVSKRKYKDIYNKLIDNIDYLKEENSMKIFNIDNERYMSPSNYLFARNYTLISSNLIFIEKELNKWFNIVKDKTKERVCIVHNNLSKDNFLRGEGKVLTGWDNYIVDTPVLDLYKLYKKEYRKLDFKNFFNLYSEDFNLLDEEKILLKILISFPIKIEDSVIEIDKVKEINKLLDYINRTNKLIKSGVFD